MSMRHSISVLLAFMAMSAHAQTAPVNAAPRDSSAVVTARDTTVLPVWNNRSGKVEALLVLEPANQNQNLGGFGSGAASVFGAGARYSLGANTLQAGISVDNSNGLALLCDARNGLMTLDSLAGRCLQASLDSTLQNSSSQNPHDPFLRPVQSVRAEARFERPESLFELSAGQTDLRTGRADWLSPTSGLPPSMIILGGNLDQHYSQQDFSARGQVNLGNDGWVSVGGTLAHARLIPTDGAAGSLGQRWNTTSVGVAAGKGNISGELIGRVVEVPGQTRTSNTFGVGLSWQTPWKGKLTVGAEHTIGKTPPTAPVDLIDPTKDDGTVPYVRYHQDL